MCNLFIFSLKEPTTEKEIEQNQTKKIKERERKKGVITAPFWSEVPTAFDNVS